MNVRKETEKWKNRKFREMIEGSVGLGFSKEQANATIGMLQNSNRPGNNILDKKVWSFG